MQCRNAEKSVRAVVFLEVEEGGQDRDEEAVKVYLIRFIADLPLRLVYGLCDSFFSELVLYNAYKIRNVILYFPLYCSEQYRVLTSSGCG